MTTIKIKPGKTIIQPSLTGDMDRDITNMLRCHGLYPLSSMKLKSMTMRAFERLRTQNYLRLCAHINALLPTGHDMFCLDETTLPDKDHEFNYQTKHYVTYGKVLQRLIDTKKAIAGVDKFNNAFRENFQDIMDLDIDTSWFIPFYRKVLTTAHASTASEIKRMQVELCTHPADEILDRGAVGKYDKNQHTHWVEHKCPHCDRSENKPLS